MGEVRIQQVTKQFRGGTTAVSNASLDIADGEFIVVVGPSGCGKTTLLRMIAGLEQPTSGSITIGGRDVTRLPPRDRNIAMVFQNYALYPHMTVRQNLGFSLKVRRTPSAEIERRVREVSDMMGLSELLERRPAQLSGGQRQRVALGRAIVREPAVFLFDEPLSNLDAQLRTRMRIEIKALHQRLGTTGVYVTHDQEEAMALGDRIVVIAGGVIQQVGTALEVYQNPANRFVGEFVGTPAMNLLDGRMESQNGRVSFVRQTDQGVLRLPMQGEAVAGLNSESEVSVGMRPTDFELMDSEHDECFEVVCKVVEHFGSHSDVTCETADGSSIVMRLDRHDIESSDRLRVRLAPRSAHVFEGHEFGRAISSPAK